jgi:hypothetical protein
MRIKQQDLPKTPKPAAGITIAHASVQCEGNAAFADEQGRLNVKIRRLYFCLN